MNSPIAPFFYGNGNPRPAKDRFLLLYPGSLNRHQGLDLAIRASEESAIVCRKRFLHLRKRPFPKNLEHAHSRIAPGNRVFIRNPMPLREIAKVIESADLGIVPKRKDTFGNEAFSTKIWSLWRWAFPSSFPTRRLTVIISRFGRKILPWRG